MNKKLIVALLFSSMHAAFGQMIESVSRPYSFDINKMMTVEGFSKKDSFTIQPYRVIIREKISEQLSEFLRKYEKGKTDETQFQTALKKQTEEIQFEIINEVGSDIMNKSKADIYFIPEILNFEIQFCGFEKIYVEVPLGEVEQFERNFSNMSYHDRLITFNESDEFVVLEMNINDPITGHNYAVQSTDPATVQTPEFTISLPGEDF